MLWKLQQGLSDLHSLQQEHGLHKHIHGRADQQLFVFYHDLALLKIHGSVSQVCHRQCHHSEFDHDKLQSALLSLVVELICKQALNALIHTVDGVDGLEKLTSIIDLMPYELKV